MDPLKPVTELIDATESLLGHSPHPAIVTLPIGAWGVSNVCDTLGLVTGHRRFDDAARLSMAVGLVGAAGAVVTGLRDYGHIPKDRPSHKIATAHALGNSIVGTLFVTSYILRQRDHLAGRRPSLGARLLALAGGGLSLYTAWLGGVLVEEHGEGVKPVMHRLWAEERAEQRRQQEEEARGRRRLAPESPLGLHAPAETGHEGT
jgi:uncharacterized membrane protein